MSQSSEEEKKETKVQGFLRFFAASLLRDIKVLAIGTKKAGEVPGL